MPPEPDPGDDPEHGSRDEHGGEGTLSPDELEAGTEKRKEAVIRELSVGEVKTDGGDFIVRPYVEVDEGGVDVSDFFDQHYDQINELLTKLIILAALLVAALFLWRVGLLSHLTDILPFP